MTIPQPIRVLELRSVRGTGGGPEKTILRGAARTNTRDFAVTVCYIRDQRDPQFALDAMAKQLGVDYVEVPERHSFDWGVWPALRRLVRERQIEIVHAHDYKTNLLALLLGRAEKNVVPLSTAHGWTGHSPRERLFYYPIDRWLLARFPQVIAVSEQIREQLIRAGARPDRVVTVLNGIDPDVFRRDPGRETSARARLGLPAGSIVIGSVGRLEPQKRFDLLIDAFASLRQSRPNLRLVIAGEGSQRADLVAQAARLNLGDTCLFTGHITDVVDVLHAFDLFVQASDYEGTPNAVLEAMAVGAPVVATTAGGTAELITDDMHGLLVPSGHAPTIAKAIARALDDPAAAARRADAARARIEGELSFARRMERVENIYVALARNASGRTAPVQP